VVREDGYNPGFGAAEGGCYTPNFCPYPEFDLTDGFNYACLCIERSQCVTEGYYVLPPNCQNPFS